MNDTTFDALANERRRKLLVTLLNENPQDDNASIATNGDSGTLKNEYRSKVAMYHTHLPRLADHGFIQWNKDAHEVVKGPRFEEIQPLLEFVDDHAES